MLVRVAIVEMPKFAPMERLPPMRSPDVTTTGQEPLCGPGFLAMLARHAGEDRYTILAHHHGCPAPVCAACAATS